MENINLRETKGYHNGQANFYSQLLTSSILNLESELQKNTDACDDISLDFVIEELTNTLDELKKKRF